MIHTGDNLAVMMAMASGSVDLVATDPPYCTGRDFGAFSDRFSLGEYLDFMLPRMEEMHRLLAPAGSLYLQCDANASHYLKVELDRIFGRANFRNEIVWGRVQGHKAAKSKFGASTDSILFYVKSNAADAGFRVQYRPGDTSHFKYDDNDGRGKYCHWSTAAPVYSERGQYDFMGRSTPKGWRYSQEKMQALFDDGHLVLSGGSFIYRKGYMTNYKGIAVNNLWNDINSVRASAKEYAGYPTQKPIALYERMIAASCPNDGVVLDPFAGSGTTLVAAINLGRSYIGIEKNADAVALARKRLREASGKPPTSEVCVSDLG